jgi:hypothetical protein
MKWTVLLIGQSSERSYRLALRIKSLYQGDLDPIITSVDEVEPYLSRQNVALVVFELPKIKQREKLDQLTALIRYYKLDCELLVIGNQDDDHILENLKGKSLRKKVSSDELLELLKQVIAKRTNSSYHNLVSTVSDRSARLEERLNVVNSTVAELTREIVLIKDCLFGSPHHQGWDTKLELLERRVTQAEEKLKAQAEQHQKSLAVFKNEAGLIVVASVGRFLFKGVWDWALENPFKLAGFIGAIAGLIVALFKL